MPLRADFYVYFHRDVSGEIFYVGKGTGRRAWSEDRHIGWKKYVAEHLSGVYTVEIHANGLSEAEAEKLEEALIAQYSKQLVNWVNFGREFDYQALEVFHRRRDANRKFVADTRPLEASDPPLAVERYRQALAEMRGYEALTLERGKVADLDVGPNWGDPNILDRLTLCLIKLGRVDEAAAEAEAYFAEFPSCLHLGVGKRIRARIDKHKGGKRS